MELEFLATIPNDDMAVFFHKMEDHTKPSIVSVILVVSGATIYPCFSPDLNYRLTLQEKYFIETFFYYCRGTFQMPLQ